MRFFLAFFAASIAYGISGYVEAVLWIAFLGTWAALHMVSPGRCPHCRHRVKFMANTCGHCGKAVRDGQAA